MNDASLASAPRSRNVVAAAFQYLAGLSGPRLVLWCYLIWWLSVAGPYFEPSLQLWLSSLGISGVIGTGLYLSTVHGAAVRTELRFWQIARLYIMPFCVSSFSALIKGRGFILIFHPALSDNLRAAGFCVAFVLLSWGAKRVVV